MEGASIVLSTGDVVLVDAQDMALVSRRTWYRHTGRHTYYARSDSFGIRVYMHRLILGVDGSMFVDHRDGNGLNNVRKNLRPATDLQNKQNRPPNAGRTFKGVFFLKRLKSKPWVARVGTKHIGYYATAEEAAIAYDDAAIRLFGEFAYLNMLRSGQ